VYAVAYVIIPTEFASLQAILDETLAPFQRGGPSAFPRHKLTFDDMTEDLRRLHRLPIRLNSNGQGVGIVSTDTALAVHIDFDAIRPLLESMGISSWEGRLADIELDLDAFARRFTKLKHRDPEAGGYGQWLNPLGRWDWWELGGRFDGAVSGHPRSGTGNTCMISSAPSKGRDLIGGIARALGGKPSEIEAEIEANIDLVSALLEAARRDEAHAFPTAVVLPTFACADGFRWFDALGWRPISIETKALLSVPDDASFRETTIAAYERFHSMAVAGLAYHF
jgi:hypothetical protein